jgi:hypothetical protein
LLVLHYVIKLVVHALKVTHVQKETSTIARIGK